MDLRNDDEGKYPRLGLTIRKVFLIGYRSNLDLVSKDTMTVCHVIRGKLHTFQAHVTSKYDKNSMMNEFKNLHNYHMVCIDVYWKILYHHFYLVMYYNRITLF